MFLPVLRLLVLIALLAPHAVMAQTKTLQLTLPNETDPSVRLVAAEFAEAVEKETGGTLTIDLGQKREVYRDNEIVLAASSGAIDIGGTTLSQFAYDVPLAGVFLQPFMFNFNALVRAAAKPGSEIRTLIDAEILYWTNTRVLWWQPNGSSVVLARTQPDDLAAIIGKRVGTPDDPSKELARSCGGEPRLVATEGLRGAFKDKAIHLAFTDIMAVKTRELWDTAEAIINTRHAPSLYVVVINDRVWQGLTPEQQASLTSIAAELQERTWDRFQAVETDAYTTAMIKGMKLYELMPADLESWRVCSSPLLEAYMERIGDLGQKLFAAYGKLRTDPCCRQVPEAATAPTSELR